MNLVDQHTCRSLLEIVTLDADGEHNYRVSLRKISKVNITDSQSGFRVYRSKVFKKIDSKESGYLYLTDVVIKAIKNGFTMEEVPIISTHRSDKPSRHSLKEVTQYISLLLRSM